MGKKDIGVFGDPSYLVHRFDDVDRAVASRKSAMSRLIASTVKGLSTKRDNMHVYGVMKTTGVFNGKPYTGYVAHIGIGLNGPGRQEDYLAAMRRLVTCRTLRMRIVDAYVATVDDLVDVIVSCSDGADTPKKGRSA